ncbi:MAG: translation elongation factor-like protein [Anaerolineales bacterium]
MQHIPVGQITRYDGELRLAVLALTNVLHEHEWLHIVGLITDLVQPAESLEVNHRKVADAGPGQEVAFAVRDRVRVYDAVFRITAAEAMELGRTEEFEPAG